MTVHIGSGILAINQTFTSGTAQDIDLTPFLASVTATQAQIEALGVCTDTNVRVPLPGVLIWVYTDSDAYPDVRTTDGSGLATFNLRQNTTYRFEIAARVPSATSPGLDDIQTEGFSWTSDGVVGVTLLPVSFDIPCATAGTAGATGTTGAGN